MIVRLLRRATKDLHDIGEYIARDNPARAASFLAELMARINGLSTMAESYPYAGLRQYPHLRRRTHRCYSVYYAVNATLQRVDVHRIVHQSRDIARIFSG